jgi:hypothetical protein
MLLVDNQVCVGLSLVGERTTTLNCAMSWNWFLQKDADHVWLFAECTSKWLDFILVEQFEVPPKGPRWKSSYQILPAIKDSLGVWKTESRAL